jgi:hypothetical protein
MVVAGETNYTVFMELASADFAQIMTERSEVEQDPRVPTEGHDRHPVGVP